MESMLTSVTFIKSKRPPSICFLLVDSDVFPPHRNQTHTKGSKATSRRAAYLHGVQGEILLLGHLYGNRIKLVGEDTMTTKIPTTHSKAAKYPAFIAYPDLAQLDTDF